MDGTVEDGFAGPGDADEPGSEIHGRPDDRVRAVLAGPNAARDDFARGDADVHGQRAPERRADVGHRPLDRVGRTHRAGRLVAVRDRRAEEGHHRIADVLVDTSAEAIDDRVDDAEVAFEQPVNVLRVEPLRQPRVAAEVSEQHRHGSALGLARSDRRRRRRRGGARERGTAAAAEALGGFVPEAARGTRHRQHGAALRAEPPSGAVPGAAGRAGARLGRRQLRISVTQLTLQRAPSVSR